MILSYPVIARKSVFFLAAAPLLLQTSLFSQSPLQPWSKNREAERFACCCG